uniref:Uncharacterized protein n=1 Tax=Rhizophora mucronata TaxID=61149 RepID=A0A2P2N1R0_RHIMU
MSNWMHRLHDIFQNQDLHHKLMELSAQEIFSHMPLGL